MKLTNIIVFFLMGAMKICCGAPQASAPLPSSCRQVVVVIAPSWSSSKGELEGYKRVEDNTWRREFGPVPVLLGKNGLAWGIGIAGQGQEGLQKQEGDWRTPVGIFKIGKLYTYDKTLPTGINYPFYTMSEQDVWISNPKSSDYNRHLTVDLKNLPSWYKKERMLLGDPPHRYMLEIRHNADSPVANAGSAIFFHIRRGPDAKTSGCTTLKKQDLLGLLRWLRAEDSPCYVLLTREVYEKQRAAWNLPVIQM